jgi:hypothetical protein
MKRQMESLKVETSEGRIVISQRNSKRDDDNSITVHLDQFDLFLRWLEEAREEIAGQLTPYERPGLRLSANGNGGGRSAPQPGQLSRMQKAREF